MDVTQLMTILSFSCLCLTIGNCQEAQPDKISEVWDKDKFKEEAGQTFNLVFHKYNHRVRPPQQYIEIKAVITLRHIRHLDLRKQELQTVLDIELDWFDSRLEWYPYKVYQIITNASNVWSPDIVYTNGVAPSKPMFPSAVRISNDGHVWWTRKEAVTTLCETKPHENFQMCVINLGFMSNSQGDQNDRFFSNTSMFIVPDTFINHEWRLETAELIIANESRSLTLDIELGLTKLAYSAKRPNKNPSQNGDSSYEIADNCSHMGQMGDGNGNGASQAFPSLWMCWIMTLVCCLGFIRPQWYHARLRR